jgi:hypothetical protein
MLALFESNPPILEIPSSDSEDELPQQCISHEGMTKLNEMRANNQLCDAAIKIESGQVFNVHRAILCSCSDYFK